MVRPGPAGDLSSQPWKRLMFDFGGTVSAIFCWIGFRGGSGTGGRDSPGMTSVRIDGFSFFFAGPPRFFVAINCLFLASWTSDSEPDKPAELLPSLPFLPTFFLEADRNCLGGFCVMSPPLEVDVELEGDVSMATPIPLPLACLYLRRLALVGKTIQSQEIMRICK